MDYFNLRIGEINLDYDLKELNKGGENKLNLKVDKIKFVDVSLVLDFVDLFVKKMNLEELMDQYSKDDRFLEIDEQRNYERFDMGKY